MRIVEIPVRSGMVRQALVTYNIGKRGTLLSIGEKLKIACPEIGISFETDLVISTCRFRDRKHFTRIFSAYKVTEDDVIVLTEKHRGEWVLSIRKRPSGHAEHLDAIKRNKKSPYNLETPLNEDTIRSKTATGHRNGGVDVPKHTRKSRTNKTSRGVPR